MPKTETWRWAKRSKKRATELLDRMLGKREIKKKTQAKLSDPGPAQIGRGRRLHTGERKSCAGGGPRMSSQKK